MISAQDVAVQSDEDRYRRIKVHLNNSSVNTDMMEVIRDHVTFVDIYDGLSHEYKMQMDADISQLLKTYKTSVLSNAILNVRRNTSSVGEFCKASANVKELINYLYILEPNFCPGEVDPDSAMLDGCLKAAVGQAAAIVIEGISLRLSEALNSRKDSGKNYGCFYTALNDLTCVLQLVDELGYRNQENREAENALRTMMDAVLNNEKQKIANDFANQISSGSGARNLTPLLDIISSWSKIVFSIRECEDLIRKVNASDESQIPSTCLHQLSSYLVSAFKNKVNERFYETIEVGVHDINRKLATFFQMLPNNGDNLEDKPYLVSALNSVLMFANERASNIGSLRKAWLRHVDPRLPECMRAPTYESALLQYII